MTWAGDGGALHVWPWHIKFTWARGGRGRYWIHQCQCAFRRSCQKICQRSKKKSNACLQLGVSLPSRTPHRKRSTVSHDTGYDSQIRRPDAYNRPRRWKIFCNGKIASESGWIRLVWSRHKGCLWITHCVTVQTQRSLAGHSALLCVFCTVNIYSQIWIKRQKPVSTDLASLLSNASVARPSLTTRSL